MHNLAAEQAVLGAILFENSILEHLTELQAEHFYEPMHGRLLERIRHMVAIGRAVDAIALKPWAAADPACKEMGGSVYLLSLIDQAPPLRGQVLSYAQSIIDLAGRRHAKGVFSDALARLESEDDLLEILADSEAGVRKVTETGRADGEEATVAGVSFIADMNKPSLSTGIAALDERLGGLHRSELVILAGRPSMGKTALAAQIARNVAAAGYGVHFASLEMPKQRIAARAMSAASFKRQYGYQRIQYYHLRNGSNVDRALLHELAGEIPRGLIIDDRAAQTLAQLENGARATRRRLKKLDLIVVDYLQLMRALRSDGRVNEVTEISQGLKAIAKRLDCPVVALSQLSRGVEGRDNKRPTLADLRDSGAIEQDADVVLACYREAYYLERAEPDGGDVGEFRAWKDALERCRRDFEVITLKQRSGPTGTDKLEAWLEFDVVFDRSAA